MTRATPSSASRDDGDVEDDGDDGASRASANAIAASGAESSIDDDEGDDGMSRRAVRRGIVARDAADARPGIRAR